MVYKRSSRRVTRRRRPSYRSGRTYRRSYRRTYTRRTPKTSCPPCECPKELTPSAKFIMAQLDPFEEVVQGAKVPDSNTIASMANTDVDIVPLASTGVATDLIGMAFRPQYTWGTVLATPGGSLSWGAAYATNASNRSKRAKFIQAVELVRPVAHAIRISSQLPPTNASGFVHIGLSIEANFTDLTWKYPKTIAEMSNLQYYKRVTVASLTQSPFTCINKWLDDTAFRYSDPTADLSTGTGISFQTDYGWATIVVLVEGAPINSTVLSVEHLILTEGIPQRDSVVFGSPAAPNNPAAMSAAGAAVSQTQPFHTEAQQESYIQQGITIATENAARAGRRVFEEVAMPLIARTSYALAGTAVQMGLNALTGRGGLPGVNNNPNRLAIG
nr:capsid protein [Cressdnaviricota sp.]